MYKIATFSKFCQILPKSDGEKKAEQSTASQWAIQRVVFLGREAARTQLVRSYFLLLLRDSNSDSNPNLNPNSNSNPNPNPNSYFKFEFGFCLKICLVGSTLF